MGHWKLEKINLPLKYDWSIARGTSQMRENLIVHFQDGELFGRSEISFKTASFPFLDDVEKQFRQVIDYLPKEINGLEHMMELLQSCPFEIFSNLRAGFEVAYIDFLSGLLQGTRAEVLGIDDVYKTQTSYSLPLLNPHEYQGFIDEHNLQRFHALKIKVAGCSCAPAVQSVMDHYSGQIWVDGNESFNSLEEVRSFWEQIDGQRVHILEQPFSHGNFSLQKKLMEEDLGCLLFADESIENGRIIADFRELFHGVNLKLMKSGGYFSLLRQVREARSLGMKVMIGCMLESSVGISRALTVMSQADYADLDSFIFLKDDAFHEVVESDGQVFIASGQ